MTHPLDLRHKAREYRRERNLTIDEIADRLAVSRTTVYYWVKDMKEGDATGDGVNGVWNVAKP